MLRANKLLTMLMDIGFTATPPPRPAVFAMKRVFVIYSGPMKSYTPPPSVPAVLLPNLGALTVSALVAVAATLAVTRRRLD